MPIKLLSIILILIPCLSYASDMRLQCYEPKYAAQCPDNLDTVNRLTLVCHENDGSIKSTCLDTTLQSLTTATMQNVSISGDTVFTGAGSGLPYGSTYGNEIGWTQATAVQNTWYEISDADMADGQLNLVAHDGNGKLTVTHAGKYLANYTGAFENSGGSKHIQTTFSVNGTETNDGMNHFETLGANQQSASSGTTILNLAANATVQVSIRTTDTGTPDLSVDHLNITLTHIGG